MRQPSFRVEKNHGIMCAGNEEHDDVQLQADDRDFSNTEYVNDNINRYITIGCISALLAAFG